jgi:secreted trypsin-like serine protease
MRRSVAGNPLPTGSPNPELLLDVSKGSRNVMSMMMQSSKHRTALPVAMVFGGFVNLACLSPAVAIIAGQRSVDPQGARASTLRIETSRGNMCSATVIARDIVLTAAHCLVSGGRLGVFSLDPSFRARQHRVLGVVPHPSFVPGRATRQQPGADLAVIRLAAPLPADIQPVNLGGGIWKGSDVTVAGFGVTAEGRPGTARILREVRLTSAGTYTSANSVVVAADSALEGEKAGASACRGDSGGPVFLGNPASRQLVGIVSWTSGALSAPQGKVCGGFTAITPVSDHAAWIASASEALQAIASVRD